MKSKLQKQTEIKKGSELAEKSAAVFFVDVANLRTADLRNLRQELKKAGNPFIVIKKRLMNLILKNRGIEAEKAEHKTPVGTVFAANLESAAGSVYKFLKQLETEKKIKTAGEKILNGYDLKSKTAIEARQVLAIGKLPPREILLAQLLEMITAPMRSLLYILKQKSEQPSENQ